MTLPTDLYTMLTLKAWLESQAQPVEPEYQCPTCTRVLPAEGFVDTTELPGEFPAWICHTCASGPHREAMAVIAEAERLAAGPDWSGIRACRDALLLRCDWTQGADAPLTSEQVLIWRDYRQLLRDITSSGTPETVVWPDPPSV